MKQNNVYLIRFNGSSEKIIQPQSNRLLAKDFFNEKPNISQILPTQSQPSPKTHSPISKLKKKNVEILEKLLKDYSYPQIIEALNHLSYEKRLSEILSNNPKLVQNESTDSP